MTSKTLSGHATRPTLPCSNPNTHIFRSIFVAFELLNLSETFGTKKVQPVPLDDSIIDSSSAEEPPDSETPRTDHTDYVVHIDNVDYR